MQNTGRAYYRICCTYGNLYIHEAKISDELYEESWIATDEEVHRFLSKYLWKLSLNDVII